VLEIDESVACPKALPEFIARNRHPRVFEERRQHLERLRLKLDLSAVFAEHTGFEIDFEGTKSDNAASSTVWLHGALTSAGCVTQALYRLIPNPPSYSECNLECFVEFSAQCEFALFVTSPGTAGQPE